MVLEYNELAYGLRFLRVLCFLCLTCALREGVNKSVRAAVTNKPCKATDNLVAQSEQTRNTRPTALTNHARLGIVRAVAEYMLPSTSGDKTAPALSMRARALKVEISHGLITYVEAAMSP